ncbi:MAG: universal stress protein [Planctomycetes bacterium]|nr:universal stress protein [Planctomycetota bacterium]
MKLLAAIDFSESSTLAARAAARLAAAVHAQLHLLHAQHLPTLALRPDAEERAAETSRRRTLLETLARELGALSHGPVTTEVADGLPDECILRSAEALRTPLVVMGAVGERATAEWNLGSVAMRVLKSSPVPVLVVREERSLERWLESEGACLRVLVGADPRGENVPPLDGLELLKGAGALEVVAGHVYMPGDERRKLASDERERELAAELLASFPVGSIARARVLPGFGRVAEHLLDLAAAESADLVLVGTHHRHGWNRIVQGSVSLDIVASARRNALVVPLRTRAPQPAELGSPTRILVPVDFSPASGAAVRWATRLLSPRGRLQLVHVTPPQVALLAEVSACAPLPSCTSEERARDRAELERRLRELVAPEFLARGVEVEVELCEGFDPAAQIASAARRLGAELICMPTHARRGFSRALLGSVAQGVVRQARVPVFVVPPEERRYQP